MPLIPRAMLHAHPPPQYLPPLPPISSISLMVSRRDQASHLTQQVAELAKIISNPKSIDFPPTTIIHASTAPRSSKSPTQLNRKGNPLRNGDLKGVGFHAAASVHPSTYQAALKTEANAFLLRTRCRRVRTPWSGFKRCQRPRVSVCVSLDMQCADMLHSIQSQTSHRPYSKSPMEQTRMPFDELLFSATGLPWSSAGGSQISCLLRCQSFSVFV